MKTALLIIDMQAHFSEMTHDCLPNILKLNTHFKTNSMPRIFTQHGHTKEELTPPFKNQLVKKWGPSGSIAKDSPDWKLMSPVAKAAEGCSIIHKNTYDAFINTNLSDVLKEQNIGRVVVCGVMTDCCCDTTARAAFNRGFETWLVSDACGTASEKQHEAGLRGFAYAFGEVLETHQALARKELHQG
ncbi:MAG: hypothetical protein Q9212_003483 [Teloschistes hypoglaucus]